MTDGLGAYLYAHCSLVSHLPLPELPALDVMPADAVCIDVSRSAVFPAMATVDWQHNFTDNQGAHAFRCLRIGDAYGFDFPGVAQAWLAADDRITLWRRPDASLDSLRHVLLDQILPRLLAQRGGLVLHAAAVHTQDHCTVLMIGDSGMGKSTLAAAFGRSGAEILSDDGVLLDQDGDAMRAIACYPGLRLWPDSLATVLSDRAAQSTAMAHYSDKRRLQQPRLAREDYPVDAILILQPPVDDRTIALAHCTTQVACMELMRNAFQLDLGDHGNIQALLAKAAATAERVPMLTLTYPRDYAMLPKVISTITSALDCPAHPRSPGSEATVGL
ncbi:MAG: HprK rel HprK-related kinase [Xanthomonadaceae bacterium]|nr:HprK rel HprK-related kinase [Xanthomonadaceae bacterium]